MAGDSTEFQIEIAARSSGVEAAADAVDRLAKQLESAESAAVKAAEAVEAGEESYKGAEKAANSAALALERIGLKAIDLQSKMQAAMAAGDEKKFWRLAAAANELEEQHARASARVTETKAALDAEAASLDRLSAAAKQATESEEQLAKQQEAMKKTAEVMKGLNDQAAKAFVDRSKREVAAAKESAAKQEEAAKKVQAASRVDVEGVTKGFKKLGGPLGQVANVAEDAYEGMEALSGSIGTAGAGAAGLTVIVVALVAAFAAGVFAIASWAVGLADAARSNELLAAGIMESSQAGLGLNSQIDDMAKRVPLARSELMKMAADLKKTGLEGHALGDALESAAEKAAKEKFGPEWQKEMLSLGRQADKLKANFAKLFGGLYIEKFLEKLATIVDLFDETSETGRAIKVVFESLFQPLIDGVVEWIPKMRSGFIQFEILVMKAMIAIKPFGSQILQVAQIAGILAAVVVGALVAAMAAGVAIAVVFWTIVLSLGKAMQWVTETVMGLGSSIMDSLGSISLTDIGTNMIMGLIGGIGAAGPALLSSLGGLVTSAIDSAKQLLGIASPSKVFAEIGNYTAEGFAGGIDEGAGAAQGSLESLTAPPATASPQASGGSGASINLAGAVFTFHGVDDAEDAEARFGALLTRLIEGDSAQLAQETP